MSTLDLRFHSLSAKLLTTLKMSRTSFNFKCPWRAKMTLFTWVQSILVRLRASQPLSSSILVLSISLSRVICVTIEQLETLSLRSTIQQVDLLSRETKRQKDVRPWLMISISLSLKKSSQRLPPSLLMDQPNFKVSFGKITPVFSLLKMLIAITSHNKLRITNVLFSNSWLCTSLKGSERNLTVFLDCHHTRT